MKKTPRKGIVYQNHGDSKVEGFSNTNCARSPNDMRSITSYCTLVGGNLVSWKSKKQSIVARSSAKSEYRAMAQVMCELLWIQQLLTELCFKTSKPMTLWCDNKATMHITSNPVFYERTKHSKVDCHFI